MSDTKASLSVSGGIGPCAVLTIVFVTLKLLGKITWSWWWVLSPSLIPLGLALAVLLFIALGLLVREVR